MTASRHLVEQITFEGQIYTVPVNIHRSNILWSSPEVLQEADISKQPASIDEFIADLRTVRTRPPRSRCRWAPMHGLMADALKG